MKTNTNADRFKLTERGLVWLKRATVSALGYDKLLFDEMEVMFNEDINDWMDSYKNGTLFEDYDPDEPLQFRNFIEDYITYLNDEPVENITYVDCSNQALQIYAILTGDLDSAKICNLAGENKRADAYQMAADECNKSFDKPIITRNEAKKPVMTTLYSKQNAGSAFARTISVECNIGMEEASKLGAEIFAEAMENLAPYAMKTMEKLRQLNDANIDTYYWTLPDGFRVKYDVKDTVELKANFTTESGVRVTFEDEIDIYGGHEFNAGMSPNVIHSIDGYIARRLIREFDEFITTIHDAYGCHFNYVDDLIALYKNIMIDILESDLLNDIMKSIADGRKFVTVPKNKTLTREHILNSDYALA